MIKLNWFLLLFLLISCKSNIKLEISQKEIIENQMIAKTGKELENEKQLILSGFGGSSLKGYEHLAISFDYFNPLTIKKARKLILFTANRFLNNLNSNDVLKTLQTNQYEIQNIKIMIFCYMADKSSARPPNLGSIWLIKNKIYYNLREEDLKTIHKETYEEALKIVENEKSSKEIKSPSE